MCISRSSSEKLLEEKQLAAAAAARKSRTNLTEMPPVQLTPLQLSKCSREDFDESPKEPNMKLLRYIEFGLIYVAYTGFLMARKNYGFWLPSIMSELDKTKGEAGLLGSTFEMSYGISSLLNGVMIDLAPPKWVLIAGLLSSALLNIGVGCTSSLAMMLLLWGANGMTQSLGWPSITNVFLAWFPDPASRGFYYSILSTCQNVGAALVPLSVSLSIAQWGWRGALWAPAAAAAGIALLLALLLHGSPEAAREKLSGEETVRRPSSAPSRKLAQMLSQQVVLNASLWLMACNYFCVSMVRTCLSDWSNVFLAEEKGLTLATAARCLFLLELGGFGGSLAAGAMSDLVFGGRRGPVICICSGMLAPLLVVLATCSSPLVIQGAYMLVGFCAFPVHVLLGLFSREVVPSGVSTSAGGFVKCIAQIGGAFAGYPLGLLQQSAGWPGVMFALAGVAGVAGVSAAPLWNTTAQKRIGARNGTVDDFQSKAFKSKSKLL